jgi:pyridoxine 5-phosphate synthase
VHLREDRRHIQDADVFALRKADLLPMNLELSLAPEILRIALRVKPAEACLVPERRQEVTTEGGLEVARPGWPGCKRGGALGWPPAGVARVPVHRGRSGPDRRMSAAAGAPCVELHTGAFCDARGAAARHELRRLIAGARQAHALGLQVNAGHGINLENVDQILQIPNLDTLNIGHSIVARAVFIGLPAAVREMRRACARYRGGRP